MFDFLRDLRKTEAEKRQEMLSSYLDDALTPAEKQLLEQLLASDEALRAALEEQRRVKMALSRLPRMRVPRNFTLDPAAYGRPAPSTADRLYPIMRVATAMVAILFVLVLVIDLAPIGTNRGDAVTAMLPETAAESEEELSADQEAPPAAFAVEETAVDEAVVEVTRVVEEAEEEAAEMAAEAPLAAELPAEEPAAMEPAAEAEEPMMEEAPAEEEAAELPVSPEEATGGGAPVTGTPLPDEGLVATLETDMAEDGLARDQAAGEADAPSAATLQSAPATIASELAATRGALARPTATSPIPAPAEDGEATGEAATGATAVVEPEAGPPASQILALALGLALVVLIVATLFLRRRAS